MADKVQESLRYIGLDLSGSALTLDSGFDSKANHKIIKAHGLLPMIYPIQRNAKNLL